MMFCRDLGWQARARLANRGILRPGFGASARGPTTQWQKLLVRHASDADWLANAGDRDVWKEESFAFSLRVCATMDGPRDF